MPQARRREVAVPEGMVLGHRAYRYRLDPTPRQERALLRYAGARRFAYNWAVEYLRDVRAVRAAELAAARAAGDPEPRPATKWPSRPGALGPLIGEPSTANPPPRGGGGVPTGTAGKTGSPRPRGLGIHARAPGADAAA